MGGFYSGAGKENRTPISALARPCNSHYTIPANCRSNGARLRYHNGKIFQALHVDGFAIFRVDFPNKNQYNNGDNGYVVIKN